MMYLAFNTGMAAPREKKNRIQWKDSDMKDALQAVMEKSLNMSQVAASPRKILDDQVKGWVVHGTKPGRDTILSAEEETPCAITRQKGSSLDVPHCEQIYPQLTNLFHYPPTCFGQVKWVPRELAIRLLKVCGKHDLVLMIYEGAVLGLQLNEGKSEVICAN